MRRREAQALVEAVRVGALDVRGELHQLAALPPGLVDGPLDEAGAEPAAPLVRVHADGLDDRPNRALAGEARHDRERQRLEADDARGPEVQDRLVEDDEFAAFDRAPRFCSRR